MEKYFSVERRSGENHVRGDLEASLGNPRSFAFANWKWDGSEFTCTNDRYGVYPIYYCNLGDRFWISSSIDLLLRQTGETELDDDAVALALRLGSNIGDETLFRRIKAVPPNSTLRWQGGKLEIQSVPRVEPAALSVSRDEAIDLFNAAFAEAIRVSAPEEGSIVVPLSGGRDSRHILFELYKQGIVPDRCLTVRRRAGSQDEDVRVAQMICKRLGLRHETVEQTVDRFSAECKKNAETGYSVQEHGWFVALGDLVKTNRWVNLYDGLAGDVLSAGLFLDRERLDMFQNEAFDQLAESVLGPEGYIPRLLSTSSLERFSRAKAVAKLKAELVTHASAPNPVGSFYFWNRTRRCVALSPFRLLRDTPNLITPFLEHKLFDLLSSLPAEHFLDHSFHTEAISRAYPELSDLAYEDKSQKPIPSREELRSFNSGLMRLSFSPRRQAITDRPFFAIRWLASHVSLRARSAVGVYGELATGLLQLERL